MWINLWLNLRPVSIATFAASTFFIAENKVSDIQTKEKKENRAAELTEHSDVDSGRLHHPGHPGHKVGDLAVKAVVVDLLCHRHAQLTRDGEQAIGLGGDAGSNCHFWMMRKKINEGKKGKVAGKDTKPRGKDVELNRCRPLTIAWNL